MTAKQAMSPALPTTTINQRAQERLVLPAKHQTQELRFLIQQKDQIILKLAVVGNFPWRICPAIS
jgi:hypothetical protein